MTGNVWRQLVITALLSVLIVPVAPAAAQAAEGWSISPGEVRVDGIRLGESTSFAITVANHKATPLAFSMSARIPAPDKLRPGYEPLPDTDWISFSPQRLELDPHARQSITVTLTLPAQGHWGGRSYEGWLSATSETIGLLQVELDSRLLLSTSAAYARGVDWLLVGAALGAMVIAGGLMRSSRRKLRRWLGRW